MHDDALFWRTGLNILSNFTGIPFFGRAFMPSNGKTVRILAKKHPFVGNIWTHSVCNNRYSCCFVLVSTNMT
jgi:hypothetical protein